MNPENGGGQSVEASSEVDGKLFNDLYKATMENRWSQVLEILKENTPLHHTKLTKSLETALHVAISTYHPETPSSHLTQMIQHMKRSGTLATVLATENQRGDTPLHLAAAVGCLPVFGSLEEKDLLYPLLSRNKKGETPLFLAALHGNLAVFRHLHKLKSDESLARRKDGNTILHKAISEENFELAYEIICKYSKMVEFINEDGESPLHVLAKKPNVFKSSSHLRFYDAIIYYCVFVEKLNDEKFSNVSPYDSTAAPLETKLKYPENYTTCVKIFLIIRDSIIVFFKNRPSDEENQYHQQQRALSSDEENQYHQQQRALSSDEENQYHQRALNSDIAEGKKGYRSYHDLFPVNYDTCIDIFKVTMKVILIILGFWRVHKIKEKKKRYLNAMDVLDKMLEDESGYKYDNNGQRPQLDPQEVSGKIEIPKAPPQFDVDDNTIAPTTAPTSSSNPPPQSNAQHNQGKKAAKAEGFITNDTPLLVAARTGILEIVKRIHKKCHVSIQDLDSNEKNVLMLAAEYRHTAVFNYLCDSKLPEYMFRQFDKDGNSILHLAAKLTELYPWRIPGAALQMQWEIKWYKHVKGIVFNQHISQSNKKGKTPRTVFSETHKDLMKAGNEWLIKTSESCSVVAALIAAVAFATSSTVPGGLNQDKGKPVLQDEKAFDVFSVASLVALCLSVTALVFFLAIITSRCEERDFKRNLPRKLLAGLSSLFASITAILLSFCSGHTFILREELKFAVIPIYASVTIPVAFFAIAQLPLYFDLLWAACKKVPLRSYKVFCY